MIPFQAVPLDRASEKRTDDAWLAAKRKDPTSYILPMWRGEPFLFKQGEKLEAGLIKPGLCESLAAPDATNKRHVVSCCMTRLTWTYSFGC